MAELRVHHINCAHVTRMITVFSAHDPHGYPADFRAPASLRSA